jgi:hypothetical protein
VILGTISCKKEADILTAALLIQQSERLSIPKTVALPSNAPRGNSRVATFYAEGVQKYKAQLVPGSSSDYEWQLVAPDAILIDANNKTVGTHGAGPFWKLSVADSIFAQHFTPSKIAASNDPKAIDWLLLMPKSGKQRTGAFANVDFIQRIATTGGKAPSLPPTSATDVADVKYTAVYRFSRINP